MMMIVTTRKPQIIRTIRKETMKGFPGEKILYSKENNNSFDDDTDSNSDPDKVLFMEIDTKEIFDDHEWFEEEG